MWLAPGRPDAGPVRTPAPTNLLCILLRVLHLLCMLMPAAPAARACYYCAPPYTLLLLCMRLLLLHVRACLLLLRMLLRAHACYCACMWGPPMPRFASRAHAGTALLPVLANGNTCNIKST